MARETESGPHYRLELIGVSIDQEESEDPIELAAPVLARVKIDSVSLYDCELHRERSADIANQSLVISTRVHDVEWTEELADGITVFLSLAMDANAVSTANGEQNPSFESKKDEGKPLAESDEQAPRPVLLSIRATLMVKYLVHDAGGLGDKNIEAFARINAIYDAWPYWRELVQNLTSRMGIRPIIVPVFRVDG
jgi:hypothetical protein